MRQPTVAMTHNLRFCSSGGVWAEWLLVGQPYGLRSVKDKAVVKDLHQALWRALPGESLLLGLCSGTDPTAVVENMLAGVDRDACPAWVSECEATLESLEEIPIGSRVFYLAVPLTPPSQMERVTGPARASLEGMKRSVGLPPQMPSPKEIQRWLVQADRVAAGIPSMFAPTPVTPAQMVWLHTHMLHRGLWLDGDMPARASVTSTKTSAALVEAILDEGGLTDIGADTGSGRRKRSRSAVVARMSVLRNRFLKVIDTSVPDLPASYQSVSVISDVPEGEMLFPGSEILGRIDESGLDVDFAIRTSVHSSTEVAKANQKALRNLNDQLHQREGEISHAGNHLDRLQKDLAEYVGILTSEKLEVEVRATMIFCVGGPTPEAAMDQQRALASWLATPEYKVLAPIGYQEALWWAMHPGVPTSQKVREFAQIAPSKSFAKLVPIATNRVGDRRGSAFALNITNGPLVDDKTPNGLTSVIMLDPEGASDRMVSGSLAVAGEMGAGKTATLMKETGDIADRGGQFLAIDRTDKGEWGRWATSVTDTTVVSAGDPKYSCDPLRIFGLEAGSRIMQTFLTPLLNAAPTSEVGVLLGDILHPDYLRQNGIDSAGALVEHVQSGCSIRGADEVARLLNVYARRDVGRIIFNPDLPALRLDVSGIVIHTAGLPLPTRDELQHEHLFQQLAMEKIFSRALHALIAAIAHKICYSDTTRLAAFVVSEVHALTVSAEGEQILAEFIRDGRKHRAVAYIDSHDPLEDFGSETLRRLIPNRLIMRHVDPVLAKHCLEWIGLDPNDDDLVDLITKHTSPLIDEEVPPHRRGEGLLRDARGNIARAKVLLPFLTPRREAIQAAGNAAVRDAA